MSTQLSVEAALSGASLSPLRRAPASRWASLRHEANDGHAAAREVAAS